MGGEAAVVAASDGGGGRKEQREKTSGVPTAADLVIIGSALGADGKRPARASGAVWVASAQGGRCECVGTGARWWRGLGINRARAQGLPDAAVNESQTGIVAGLGDGGHDGCEMELADSSGFAVCMIVEDEDEDGIAA